MSAGGHWSPAAHSAPCGTERPGHRLSQSGEDGGCHHFPEGKGFEVMVFVILEVMRRNSNCGQLELREGIKVHEDKETATT